MKKYSLREKTPKMVRENLSDYSKIIQNLLYARGIETKEKAEEFLNPDYERDTNSPLLLKDIGKAVKRILKAIKNKEKILIYSDYDADGIPGAVVLHDFFKKIGYKNFSNYIPHRNDEGFGLNSGALKKIAKDKVDLIITVDCGITDVKEVNEAKKLGMEVIITDHHLPNGSVPKAYAIINPNQKGDKYPFKYICGTAVAYKLVQVLIEKGDFNLIKGWEKWLLDMVGLATVSDMVSLTEENRALVYYGLLVLRKTQRNGLLGLFSEVKINKKYLNEDDISFVITPRINAASRMGHAQIAYELLKSTNPIHSKEAAKTLNKMNDKRKILVAGMTKELKRKLSKFEKIPEVIVSGNPKWKPSLLGLVASSVAGEYDKPVFLWGKNNAGQIKGSCRSDQRTDVFSLMNDLPKGFLGQCGGHKFSGGFELSQDNIHSLEKKLIEAFKKTETSQQPEEILIDGELSIEDIHWKTVNEIFTLAPYGKGNPKPIFIFRNIDVGNVTLFGKERNHLKIELPNGHSKPISAISFFSTENSFGKKVSNGDKINLVASVEKSYFRGFPELRLRIVDII